MPTGLLAIHPATSSASSMSQVPEGACRTLLPEIALPAPPEMVGSRKSLPSSSVAIPSDEHCAAPLHQAGVTPLTGLHAALAVSPRPSAKSTMKSPLQFTQGPLLVLGKLLGKVLELANSHGLVCPPMYQAALNSISASG